MDILENLSLRGKAFVNALASFGDTVKDGPSWGQLGANMSQLGAILGPTWGQRDQVGPTWANMRQLGANLGPTWDPLGAILGATWPNMGQHEANLEPTWGSLGANSGQL